MDTHVKDYKKSFDVYVMSNARNESLLVRSDQKDLAFSSFHSANVFAAYFVKVYHQMATSISRASLLPAQLWKTFISHLKP